MSKLLIRSLLVAGGIIGASLAGRAALRHLRRFEWRGKRVLITGGSRGLGLAIARQLVALDAHVALCARSEDELQSAKAQLQACPGLHAEHSIGIKGDVRDPLSMKSVVGQLIERWGGVDVLINTAGIISVGPWESMKLADFHNAMDTNCWGALHATQAVVPCMRRQGWGRIVHIASLGGQRAVPHMLPYAASKFGLVGLSTGLRTELAKDNILVVTVCPGLMRTGSPRNAQFKSQHRKEYTWFSLSDSMPLISVDAEIAADKVLQACQHGDPLVTLVGPLNLSGTLAKLAPNWTIEALSLADRLLPSQGNVGQQTRFGFESETELSPSALTQLSDAAAVRNNEV